VAAFIDLTRSSASEPTPAGWVTTCDRAMSAWPAPAHTCPATFQVEPSGRADVPRGTLPVCVRAPPCNHTRLMSSRWSDACPPATEKPTRGLVGAHVPHASRAHSQAYYPYRLLKCSPHRHHSGGSHPLCETRFALRPVRASGSSRADECTSTSKSLGTDGRLKVRLQTLDEPDPRLRMARATARTLDTTR